VVPPTPGGPACANVTCNGHGTCYSDGSTAFCQCDPGFYGRLSNQQCEASTGTACDGVTCGGAGTCVSQFVGGYQCQCLPGYQPYGPSCVLPQKLFCRNADGSLAPRGTTRCSADDLAIDVCADFNMDGTVEWGHGVDCAGGLTCSGGCLGMKCPDQPCPFGTACVPEAHGQPLGVCVVTCDCMNCANCGPDNSDGRWNDEQEYCGVAPNAPGPATQACRQPCPNAGDGCIPYNPSICWPIEGCFSAPP
jgi:Notch-like protein